MTTDIVTQQWWGSLRAASAPATPRNACRLLRLTAQALSQNEPCLKLRFLPTAQLPAAGCLGMQSTSAGAAPRHDPCGWLTSAPSDSSCPTTPHSVQQLHHSKGHRCHSAKHLHQRVFLVVQHRASGGEQPRQHRKASPQPVEWQRSSKMIGSVDPVGWRVDLAEGSAEGWLVACVAVKISVLCIQACVCMVHLALAPALFSQPPQPSSHYQKWCFSCSTRLCCTVHAHDVKFTSV